MTPLALTRRAADSMRVQHSEMTRDNAGCEICRGGELPVEALPQMVEMAIKHGYLTSWTATGLRDE